MIIQAAITGDIVGSTRLDKTAEKKLHREITEVFGEHKFEFYRGDSFQAYIKKPQIALQLALRCRAIAISLSHPDEAVSSDIRISIGIGNVELPVRSLRTAKGEAFLLSGRALDEITKTGRKMAIAAGPPMMAIGMQVVADYIDSIFQGMTAKQAEVVVGLLRGLTQQAVARKLKKTKSTVHQRVTAARWAEIEQILIHYENLVNTLI